MRITSERPEAPQTMIRPLCSSTSTATSVRKKVGGSFRGLHSKRGARRAIRRSCYPVSGKSTWSIRLDASATDCLGEDVVRICNTFEHGERMVRRPN